jgi:hypothetical protein
VALVSTGLGPFRNPELQTWLARSELGPGFLLAVALLSVPVSAFASWMVAWVPIRVGAGPAARLWEVAAWAHAPLIVASLGRLLLAALPGASQTLPSLLVSLLGVAWSTWVVYHGLCVFSPRSARRGATLYGVLFALLALLGGSFAASLGSRPGGVRL